MPITLILAILMIVALYFLTKPKPQSKIPTIEDIRRKYPKRKSQEQLRREAQQFEDNQRREQIDREQLGEALAREQELFSLVRDIKTRDRLINGLRRKYPQRSRLWLAEKAIADVQRDRRTY
jgi:hypothetical protein